jgi:hypothetical protein
MQAFKFEMLGPTSRCNGDAASRWILQSLRYEMEHLITVLYIHKQNK